jgi:WD40 repeat protein
MITSLNFSKSGTYVLSTSIDNSAIVWNVTKLSKEEDFKLIHNNGIFAGKFDNAGCILTSGGDQLIKVHKHNKQFL